MDVVFWQQMYSPHMMGLAEALAARGHKVFFVAQEELSKERKDQGWSAAKGIGVERRLIDNPADAGTFIAERPASTVHITQGLRGNAELRARQDQIAATGQRLWVIMETVDTNGWRKLPKRALYRYTALRRSKVVEGILAIGEGTAQWLVARGFSSDRVFPFAYFIPRPRSQASAPPRNFQTPFTFAFVGNLEPWKNPGLVLDAYRALPQTPRRLLFVGDGTLRPMLEARSREMPPGADIAFFGRIPMDNVADYLLKADCLILPSLVDGWGVVASEAMLLGTPVVVSDVCGVRGAVGDAPAGAVFRTGRRHDLTQLMAHIQATPHDPAKRATLASWAQCLSAGFGAAYLESLLMGTEPDHTPNWLRRREPQP